IGRRHPVTAVVKDQTGEQSAAGNAGLSTLRQISRKPGLNGTLAAIPALAHAQQGGPQPKVPKPTKADAQNVVQIVTSDKVKTQAYCDLTKLEGQVKAADQKNDTKTLEALNRQAELLLDKIGPEYFNLMDGLEE